MTKDFPMRLVIILASATAAAGAAQLGLPPLSCFLVMVTIQVVMVVTWLAARR
jgi:hypothetical protein